MFDRLKIDENHFSVKAIKNESVSSLVEREGSPPGHVIGNGIDTGVHAGEISGPNESSVDTLLDTKCLTCHLTVEKRDSHYIHRKQR